MANKKSSADDSFLTTAAQKIGSTLGQLREESRSGRRTSGQQEGCSQEGSSEEKSSREKESSRHEKGLVTRFSEFPPD
jgi:hypothetical protein